MDLRASDERVLEERSRGMGQLKLKRRQNNRESSPSIVPFI